MICWGRAASAAAATAPASSGGLAAAAALWHGWLSTQERCVWEVMRVSACMHGGGLVGW